MASVLDGEVRSETCQHVAMQRNEGGEGTYRRSVARSTLEPTTGAESAEGKNDRRTPEYTDGG